MKPNTILLLQSLLITAQTINAGLAAVTHNAVLALVVCAAVGGFQFFVQHIGNQTQPK